MAVLATRRDGTVGVFFHMVDDAWFTIGLGYPPYIVANHKYTATKLETCSGELVAT